MFQRVTTHSFNKQYKKILKSNPKIIWEIQSIMSILESGKKLNLKYNHHPLIGNYIGYFECHIKFDLLLIYKFEGNKIIFDGIGSHSELFK
jgi:mRNA interferase YafQ